MSAQAEFAVVDLVLASGAATRGVDAFALALIKSERQARRLFTYLVYQHPWCDRAVVPQLRRILARRRGVYFDGVLAGWDALYPRSIEELIGLSIHACGRECVRPAGTVTRSSTAK